MTEIAPVVVKSFAVYVMACIILDRIRLKYPAIVIQSGILPVKQKEKKLCIETAFINLGVGAMMLFLFGKWIRISKTKNQHFFFEFAKLLVMFLVSDTMFYWSHRILHLPTLYKIAHRQHHSHNEPISWTSLFVHPIEFAIALTGIFLIPLLIFSMHPGTATTFLIGVMLSLAVSHSGIRIGNVINPIHHDLHHQLRRGNFGSDVGIWDRICCTQIETKGRNG